MPPADDEFDTIIQIINDGLGEPEPTPPPSQPHRVLRFALGAVLWLLVANLSYVLGWLLAHG